MTELSPKLETIEFMFPMDMTTTMPTQVCISIMVNMVMKQVILAIIEPFLTNMDTFQFLEELIMITTEKIIQVGVLGRLEIMVM